MGRIGRATFGADLARLTHEIKGTSNETVASRLGRTRQHVEDLPLFSPELDSLFRDLDDAVVKVSGEKAASTLRLGSIAAHRSQADFYYRVASSPALKVICEVGFNVGHSTAVWLTANPTAHVHTFDLLKTRAGQTAYALLSARFAGRLTMHAGDSARTVPLANLREPCDLVHVDGRHDYFYTVGDCLNLLRHTRAQALFLFDDQCDPSGCTSLTVVPGLPTLATCDLVSSGILSPLTSFYGRAAAPIARQFALFRLTASDEARALAAAQPLPKLPCAPLCDVLWDEWDGDANVSPTTHAKQKRWRSKYHGAQARRRGQRSYRPDNCSYAKIESETRPEYMGR